MNAHLQDPLNPTGMIQKESISLAPVLTFTIDCSDSSPVAGT